MPSLILRLVLIAAVIVGLCQLPTNASRKRPTALVTPISYDPRSTNYSVEIGQRTPLRVLQLLLDIEQDYMWVRCYNNTYKSSTYRPVDCSTKLCKSYEYSACYTCFGPRAPACNNHSCSVPEPGVQLGQDVAEILSSDGRKSGLPVRFPRLPFACAEDKDPSDLLPGVDGVAGMSSSTLALPAQLSAAGGFSRKFAMCLPQENSEGYLFFGDGPNVFSPLKGGAPTDVSRNLIRTPLIRNPIYSSDSTHASTHGFYIGVQGIKVNGVDVPIDAEKLRINTRGRGGTKLSTVARYTQLATPIYNSLVALYTQMAAEMNIKRVTLVDPFPPLGQDVCFDATGTGQPPFVGSTAPGPNVPTIDLVLEGNATWSILGANSMERLYRENALCLAFVDAGEDPVASIVMGTYQMQENFIQFDLVTSTLGLSSHLFSLPQPTSCGNFNLTTSL